MGGKSADNVMPTGVSVHGKTLRVAFQYRGQRCRESLGLAPTKTNIKYAAGKLAAIKYEIKTGIFSYPSHFPESPNALRFQSRSQRTSMRIGELCEEFKVMKYAEVTVMTAYRMSSIYSLCLDIIGPNRLISALFPEDIRRLRSELICTRAAATCNGYMAAMREFLRFAEQNGYTDKALSAELKRVKMNSKDPDPFSLDEMQRAFKACRRVSDENLFRVAVYTGLRPGELMAMAWEDIDFQRQELTISRAVSAGTYKLPKTNKSRIIALSPPAMEALKNQQQFTFMKEAVEIEIMLGKKEKVSESIRPVFSPMVRGNKKEERFFSIAPLRRLWEQLTKRAGLRHRTIYQLRHTFACWNLTAHGNVAFIAKQMGHADYTMLVKVYGRWMDAESHAENAKIWESLKSMGHVENAPTVPQDFKRIG